MLDLAIAPKNLSRRHGGFPGLGYYPNATPGNFCLGIPRITGLGFGTRDGGKGGSRTPPKILEIS